MALTNLYNDDGGLLARTKINTAFETIDAIKDSDLPAISAEVAAAVATVAAAVTDITFLKGKARKRDVYLTKAEAEAADVPADVGVVLILGHTTAGDGGGGEYVRSAIEPIHLGKLQTNDEQWWELADWAPNPKQFGAPWNGDDDDLAATHACSYFCRVTQREMRLPPGSGRFSDTLYLGSLTVRGAGPANRNDSYRSKTMLICEGNPGLCTMKDSASAYNSGSTNLEYFTVVPDIPHDVSKTKTAKIWDNNAYPYRIGIYVGRPPNFMQTVASGEADGQGTGLVTMRGVDVDGFSGMAIYGYKLYGKSLIDDCYLRRCGGAGAYDEGSNRYCGFVRFDSECADVIISNGHWFQDGYPNPDGSAPDPGENSVYDNKGFGLRLSANKALVEGETLDRKWFPTGKIRLINTQIEAVRVPLDVRATTWLHVGDGCILNGSYDGTIYLGDPANPHTQNRVTFGRVYLNNVGTIVQQSGSAVDLGDLVVFDQVGVKTYAGVKIAALGAGADPSDLHTPNITLTPMRDPTDIGVSSASMWRFLPWFDTNGVDRGLFMDQRLPAFGVSGFVDWEPSDEDAVFNSPYSATVSSGASIQCDLTGLSPGTLMTAHFFFRQAESFNLAAVEYGIKDGSGNDWLRRPLGVVGPPNSDRALYRRAFQFLVPDDGVARVFMYSAGVDIECLHPCVNAGASMLLPERALLHWPTPSGIVPCN